MARHPVPTREEAVFAAAAIVQRRSTSSTGLDAPPRSTLESVVAHIAESGNAPVPIESLRPPLTEQDVVDALLVMDYLEDAYMRRLAGWRLGIINAGRALGMTWARLQAPLHQRHRQGVVELTRRLRGTIARD